MVHCLVASWVLLGAAVAGPQTVVDRTRYDGYALIEVHAGDRDAIAALLATGADPWVDSVRPGFVPVLVAPEERAAIDAAGWSVRVVTEDVQRWVDEEFERLAVRPRVSEGGDPFADFRDLAEVEAILADLAASSPELATVIELGMSIEGRPIRGLHIGTGNGSSPTLYVQGGQHAREWISVSTALWIATKLVQGVAEPQIAALLGEMDVVVVPVVNPDGYAYTWTNERFWRKNRRDGIGVDTNRNFAVGWGGEGAGTEPQEDNYAGPAAFSEPESSAVRDYVAAHPEVVSFLDLHSFGQLILWPWGHIQEPAPDAAALEAMGGELSEAMYAVHEYGYSPIQGVDLYPAAGNAIDWAYGDADLRSYTIELRPTNVEEFEQGFVLGTDQIVPVGEEAMAAVLVLAEWTAQQDVAGTGGDETTTSSGGSSEGSADTSADESTSDGGVVTTTMDASASGATLTSAGSEDGTSSDGDGGENEETGGCGCTSGSPARFAGLAMFALMLLTRRRR